MVDFPHRLVTKAEFAFGADPAGDPGTWTWTDVTDRRQAQSITITRGRLNEGAQSQTGSITLTLDNLDGALTPDQATSPYFPHVVEGTPLRFSLQWDGVWYTLFFGEVASWEPDWPYGDLSNEDTGYVGEARVIVTANGITRRLGQGTKALKDPLRRHIDAGGPLLYWPLTDGQTAREGTEIVRGAQPMRSVGEAGSFYQGQPNWGRGSLAPWLDPVVSLPVETGGLITAYVPPMNLTGWSVDHVLTSLGPGNITQVNLFDDGPQTSTVPQVEWDIIEWGSGGFNEVQVRIVERLESSSSTALLTTISDPGIYDGGVHHLRLSVADDGAGAMTWELFIDGVSVASGTRATAFRALSRITGRWSLVSGGGINDSDVALGHITYWGASPPFAADTWRAVQGHNRELAGRRIERLCAEQGVPLLVNGNLDQSPAMGPQKPGVFLDLMQSAADVDGGVLYEARDTPGLEYRTLKSKYNQGV